MASKVLLLLITGFLLGQIVGSATTPQQLLSVVPPPSSDPFFVAPKNYVQAELGTILRSRKFSTSGILLSGIDAVYQFLYRTTDALDRPSVSVTSLLIPTNADMTKHVAYHIAYDSSDWDCSPSYAFVPGSASNESAYITSSDVSNIQTILSKNIPVSTSDYEGEKASFTSGIQAAHGVLDAIKAVISSSSLTGINPMARTVMFGYSGGSIATEWASEFQSSYAPKLNIIAAALGGLPVKIGNAYQGLNGQPFAGLILASLTGLASSYPNLTKSLNQHLKPSMKALFYSVHNQCPLGGPGGGFLPSYLDQDISKFFNNGENYFSDPVLTSVLETAGIMGRHGTPKKFPLYIYKGTADEVVPTIQDTDDLVKQYCNAGATIKYYRYLNGTHETTASQGSGAALDFLFSALNGKKITKSCTKTNVSMVPVV